MPLEISVDDALGRKPQYNWVVGGPAQGYVERHAQRAWQLHTTAPGSLRLTLIVIGSNGTRTTQSLDIEVTAQ